MTAAQVIRAFGFATLFSGFVAGINGTLGGYSGDTVALALIAFGAALVVAAWGKR